MRSREPARENGIPDNIEEIVSFNNLPDVLEKIINLQLLRIYELTVCRFRGTM